MVIRKSKRIFTAVILTLLSVALRGQEKLEIVDYMNPSDYKIGGITISGVKFLDTNALIGISGLRVGQEIEIPGDALTTAAKKLYSQGLFSDIRITISKIVKDSAYFDIALQERPRISAVKYNGLKKGDSEDLIKKISLPVGSR